MFHKSYYKTVQFSAANRFFFIQVFELLVRNCCETFCLTFISVSISVVILIIKVPIFDKGGHPPPMAKAHIGTLSLWAIPHVLTKFHVNRIFLTKLRCEMHSYELLNFEILL